MRLAGTLVSIIIPNYNGRLLLEQNLPSVMRAAGNSEIIVVDDASTDDSVAWLRHTYPHLRLIVQSVNSRFAAVCNAGVRAAQSDIVILLNSDVQPTSNFLEPLVSPFGDSQVFAVGCAEINPHINPQTVSGRSGGAYQRGLIVHWRCPDQNQESTFWVSGGSGAFRKGMWQQLGGMDLMFKPAYEEDRDICYRALKRGWKVKFAPQSVVYHRHETTNRTALGAKKMRVASLKNHLLLVWKNITQPALLMQHLLWLPYHLIFTSLRTQGDFLLGFFLALGSLPAVLRARVTEYKEGVVSDEIILSSFKD